ncbi:hypothetical protein [Ferrimonas marina]|nr:hypothetical protein [Ferrimonas marina]
MKKIALTVSLALLAGCSSSKDDKPDADDALSLLAFDPARQCYAAVTELEIWRHNDQGALLGTLGIDPQGQVDLSGLASSDYLTVYDPFESEPRAHMLFSFARSMIDGSQVWLMDSQESNDPSAHLGDCIESLPTLDWHPYSIDNADEYRAIARDSLRTRQVVDGESQSSGLNELSFDLGPVLFLGRREGFSSYQDFAVLRDGDDTAFQLDGTLEQVSLHHNYGYALDAIPGRVLVDGWLMDIDTGYYQSGDHILLDLLPTSAADQHIEFDVADSHPSIANGSYFIAGSLARNDELSFTLPDIDTDTINEMEWTEQGLSYQAAGFDHQYVFSVQMMLNLSQFSTTTHAVIGKPQGGWLPHFELPEDLGGLPAISAVHLMQTELSMFLPASEGLEGLLRWGDAESLSYGATLYHLDMDIDASSVQNRTELATPFGHKVKL